MNYSFHPQARIELLEAAAWYEEAQPGLGLQFAEEIYATIQRATQFPKSGARLSPNTRRGLTRRFPYGIIYQIANGEMFIVAVSHLRRKPGYWRTRI